MKILEPYRQKIDLLDDQIVDLLVEREKVIRDVADIKAKNDIPAILEDRVDEVRDRCVARAKEKGMDGNYVRKIYKKIIRLSCDIEEHLKAVEKNKND